MFRLVEPKEQSPVKGWQELSMIVVACHNFRCNILCICFLYKGIKNSRETRKEGAPAADVWAAVVDHTLVKNLCKY